jgi:hypothetical protein
MYLGSFGIDDYVGIPAATHRFSTGAAYAPTSLTYSIYEEQASPPTGIDEDVDMIVASPLDAIVGCYWVRRQLTAAAGFEAGKNYVVVVKATVDSVAAIQMHTFQVAAKVDARYVGGTIQTAGDVPALVATADAAVDALATTVGVAGAGLTAVVLATPAPTALENADALLKRDMSAVSGESARSPLNALRLLRNKWSVAAGTLTVTKEDDTASAWTSTVSSDAAANPITGSDPA